MLFSNYETSEQRKNRYLYNIIFLFILVASVATTFSCSPSKNIDFQIMRPAQVKLGFSLDRVVLCYDSSLIKNMNTTNPNNAQASRYFMNYLYENLQRSPLFKKAKFTILSSESNLSIIKDNIIKANENGVAIVLDKIYTKNTLMIKDLQYANLKSFRVELIHKFSCRTYNLKDMQIVDNHLLQDTFFCPVQEAEWKYQIFIPDISALNWDTGIQASEKYAHYLAPYWADQSRKFFYGNKKFNTAYKLIQRDNLDSALIILQKIKKRKMNLNKVFKAYYNKAVVYELQDDFDNAIIMADSAFIVSNNKIAKDYIKKLRLRKIDKTALDWQLN